MRKFRQKLGDTFHDSNFARKGQLSGFDPQNHLPEYMNHANLNILAMSLEKTKRFTKPISFKMFMTPKDQNRYTVTVHVDWGCFVSIIHPEAVEMYGLKVLDAREPFVGYTFKEEIVMDKCVKIPMRFTDEIATMTKTQTFLYVKLYHGHFSVGVIIWKDLILI